MAKAAAKNNKLTKTTDGEDKEFAAPDLPIEGTKSQMEDGSGEMEETAEEAPKLPAREIVRGEDVLKIMRAKGVKI
jgi:hypothetical protein